MWHYVLLAIALALFYWCSRLFIRVLAEWQEAGWRYAEAKRIRAEREARWIQEFNAAIDTIEPECGCADPKCGMDTDQLCELETEAKRKAAHMPALDSAHIHSRNFRTLH